MKSVARATAGAPETPADWSPAPDVPVLAAGEVQVWRLPLPPPSETLGRLRSRLSGEELERAERFVFPEDRDRFTAARGALREILARYVLVPPSELRFEYSSYGKPELQRPSETSVRFNASHSGAIALFALTLDRAVGVDVERVREDFDELEIAERFFSTREMKDLRALPEPLRKLGFFTCWTRKEAYIKGIGEGLSMPLDRFDVSLVPGSPAALLHTRGGPEASRWSLAALDPGPGYVGALAVPGDVEVLRLWRFESR
jgi:4'-phosphopantetheinyl transferase